MLILSLLYTVVFSNLSPLSFMTPTAQAQAKPQLVEVVSGLENPWAIAWFSPKEALITERPGRMRVLNFDTAKLSAPLSGVPAVDARGQGGLLDVAVDPQFNETRLIFWTYAESAGQGRNHTAVARGRLSAAAPYKLEDVRVIFRQEPSINSSNHFGSRIVFDKDGSLFVGLGDRYSQRDSAQDPKTHLGKIVRISRDGSKPAEVLSIGHRNIQGMAINPASGELWAHEHGARGGDEVNWIRKGLNYGWPVITHGVDYDGTPIGEGTAKPGMEQPLWYYVPSIAPSGMAFYTGDVYPDWKGNLFIGALAETHLRRVVLNGRQAVQQEALFESENHRVRDVRQGPDGYLYLLTDSGSGKLLKVVLKP